MPRVPSNRCVWLLMGVLAAGPASSLERNLNISPQGHTGEDTAALQAAFLQCRNPAHPCRIQLGSGTFYTDVLLAKGFHGTIQGRGQGKTLIKPIAHRPLRSTRIVLGADPTLAEPYPILMHFADGGDVTISGLTIELPDDMRTMPWELAEPGGSHQPIEDALLAAIMVDGAAQRARLLMYDVTIVASDKDIEPFGSNTFNCVRFEGQLRFSGDTDLTRSLSRGAMTAYQNTFRRCGLAIALRDANNVDGLAVGNNIDVRTFGLWSADMGKSRIAYVRNHVSSEVVGIGVTRAVRPAEEPSTFLIAQNRISINERGTSYAGIGFDGIAVQDYSGFDPGYAPAMRDKVEIFANDISLGVEVLDGIFVLGDAVGGVRAQRNRISGHALEAGVVVDQSLRSKILRNDLSGLQATTADIHLYPGSREVKVVQPGAKILDEGVDNVVH